MKNKEKRKKVKKFWLTGFIPFADKMGYATIATYLGYKDSAVVRNWIYRKSIPSKRVEEVKKLMENNK